MASEAQIIANQANAQHSTGPKSAEGKARVAQNRTTHGLAGRTFLLPGEDQHAYMKTLAKLTVDHLPSTAIESALIKTIAQTQWRIDRAVEWEADLMTEALEGDPSQPSRLMTMFSKSAAPSEALAKLHRYEASLRRTLQSAYKELRLQKTARHRANTVEAATTTRDIRQMAGIAKKIRGELGLPSPPVDNSNPIAPPQTSMPASEAASETTAEAAN
jgi:hypothetical protein